MRDGCGSTRKDLSFAMSDSDAVISAATFTSQTADVSFRLRSAVHGDEAAVQAIVFGVLRAYGLSPDPELTDADLADLEAAYVLQGGRFSVLEAASSGAGQNGWQIIGTVGLLPLPGHPTVGELRKMYLHPDWRGRGLGKRLLERALADAPELGFQEIVLETASVLAEAVALYRRYGFEPLDVLPGHAPAARCDMVLGRKV